MAKAALKLADTFLQPGIVNELPLDLVDFDPEQPRKDIDSAYIAELAADIAANGVMQPITVRPNPNATGRYYVVYGECRTRASRVAEKLTIPALLAPEHDDLTRLLNQVKENHLRRALNPIELANVLKRLRDDHKIKSASRIEETLKAHGITNLSESYISNLIRLITLPDWAQQLIREGRLTAAHGKFILQALPSEVVTEELREELQREGADYSVRDLQQYIDERFFENHTQLNLMHGQPINYNEECIATKCKRLCKISGSESNEGGTYCLDRSCYEIKRTAAIEAQRKAAATSTQQQSKQSAKSGQQPPIEDPIPTYRADGTFELADEGNSEIGYEPLYVRWRNDNIDPASCAGCQHRHMVTADGSEEGYACFSTDEECFDKKLEEASIVRKEKKQHAEAMRDKYDAILNGIRQRLAELANSDDLDLALTITLAAALALEDRDGYVNWEDGGLALSRASGIRTMRKLLQPSLTTISQHISHLLDVMTADHLVPLAQHYILDITTIDGYSDELQQAWSDLVSDAEATQSRIEAESGGA